MLLVASFTDAWIETSAVIASIIVECVASFTDAWIETYLVIAACWASMSRPSRTRGLKPSELTAPSVYKVASFTDAWIETITTDMVKGQSCRVLHGRVD